jgi:hypothetical protein
MPDRWIGRGGPQNLPLLSLDLTHPEFPCMGLHEKHGVLYERKAHSREELYHRMFDAARCMMTLMFYVRFKSS